MTVAPELWQALLPVIDALESLAVPHYLGGSVASSFSGVARATQDADLVADLRPHHAAPFISALGTDYYADLERIQHGIQVRRSFNVIHMPTGFKVDVFVLTDSAFARANMSRRVALDVPQLGRTLWFSSPEDIVLHKLQWFVAGGGVSDRQWYDLQGVLRIQGEALDFGYLQDWAERLDLADLLARAMEEAGIEGAESPG
jgi:hypothetical protein